MSAGMKGNVEPPEWRPTPIRPAERIDAVDALRGFALLGILIVNLPTFALDSGMNAWTSLPDKLAVRLVDTFVAGKFIILFSALFGVSFALQLERLEARSSNYLQPFLRRQWGLLLLGAAHLYFFYFGDILMLYAVLGICLIPFRHSRPAFLLVTACAVYVFSFVAPGLAGSAARNLSTETASYADVPSMRAEAAAGEATGMSSAYASGDFAQIVRQRFGDFIAANPAASPVEYPRKFAFFLVGLCLVRSGVIAGLHRNRRRLVQGSIWGLCIGLAATIGLYFVYLPGAPTWISALRMPLIAVQNPALALLYACLSVLAMAKMPSVLRTLAATGRLALSNYLLQSVIASTLFYSYGFALFGRLGPSMLLGLCFGIFAIQIFLSVWWLSVFRFGPLEGLLRMFSYKSREIRMRR